MLRISSRLVLIAAALWMVAGCGASSNESPTTSDNSEQVTLEGRDGDTTWRFDRQPDGDGFCLSLELDPPVQAIELGAVPSGAEVMGASAIARPVGSSPRCYGGSLSADPESVSFEPVFAPFIYQGTDFRRSVIAGAVDESVDAVTLELASGSSADAPLLDQSLFVAFPPEAVAAIQLVVGDVELRCPIEPNQSGWRVGICD